MNFLDIFWACGTRGIYREMEKDTNWRKGENSGYCDEDFEREIMDLNA